MEIDNGDINCTHCGNKINWFSLLYCGHGMLGWYHRFKCPKSKPEQEIKEQNVEVIEKRIRSLEIQER